MLLTCLLFKSWFLSLIHCKSCNPLECKFHMDSDFCPLFIALSPVPNSDKPARVHAFIKRLLNWCIRQCSSWALHFSTAQLSPFLCALEICTCNSPWPIEAICTCAQKSWKVSGILHSLSYFPLGLSIGKWKSNSLAPRKDKP